MTDNDLFAKLKSIDLAAHIERLGSRVSRVGENRRANPCPLCGHNDCCTIYPDNSFNCFSCGRGGDIVVLTRLLEGHGRNIDAAMALAAQYNIAVPGGKAGAAKKPGNIKERAGKKAGKKAGEKKDASPGIDPDRAAALRQVAAEYFHSLLLGDREAADYQANTRGHSMEVLGKHLVGYMPAGTAGHVGLVARAKDAGYTPEDLAAVCLMRRRGRGYGPYIPQGVYIYPHFSHGRILHFSFKDPKKIHEYQLKRAAADPAWLCYGQDALDSGEVWLVEGENDRLTLMERGGIKNVAAVLGNTTTPRMLEWIAGNAAGKTFYLCFDPDDAGRKYAAKYSAAILNGGGNCYVADLAEYGDDIDAVLRKADDPAAVAARVRKDARRVDKSDLDGPPSYEFASFEVLGESAEGSLVFWSNVFHRTYIVALKDLTLDQLCQIGGAEVRGRVSRSEVEGMIPFKSLKTHLIVQAAQRYLGRLKIMGQGIHLLRDNRLLVVDGDEAVVWDGHRFARQQHPLIDGQFISWESDLRWIDLGDVQEAVLSMTRERAEKIFERLLELLAQWRFAGNMDLFILAGWIVAQIVQTAWDWRPQLWLSGSSGSGKTMLSLLIEALGGGLVCRFEGNILTEPGLRQTLQNHAWMTIIDEFEESPHRDRIIERLRSAGRGGKGAIGSTKQEAISTHIRHMILIASIETGLVRAAEQYRYIQIQTSKDNTRHPTIPAPAECEKLQVDLVAYALWGIYRAKELLRNMQPVPGYDNRWVHSVAVPLSMLAVCDPAPEKSLGDALTDYLAEWSSSQAGNIMEDEAALLQDILLASIRLSETQTDGMSEKNIYVERTVAQILAEDPPCEEHDRTLQAYGVRYMEREGGALFLHPETIAKKLLYYTRWRSFNLRDILLRSPGAVRCRQRVAGAQVRGVMLPREAWQADGDGE